MPDKHLHVLVVDDSAVVRQAMTMLLGPRGDFSTSVAADPLIAMEKMKQRRPDVIVLDLEMPRMDGITFLRKIMSEDPIPVIVCSGLVGEGTSAALRALDEGAVDIIAKPQLGVRDFLQESAVTLADTIRAAAVARPRHRRAVAAPRLTADAILPPVGPRRGTRAGQQMIAIGASTGGPEALAALLQPLPGTTPGIVIVQHMPDAFTGSFARRLDSMGELEVREARAGDRVERGVALVAPGNRHLIVVRHGDELRVDVLEGPLVSRHRPSVDVLFRSVAQAAGAGGIGVILTGMGNDGAAGLLEMRASGCTTVAQDESSSVVFGMPKEAIAHGAVEHVVGLREMPPLFAHLTRTVSR